MTFDGKEHNLHDWRGKVIMMNFRATWCGPCQIEMPYFMKYQQYYAGQELQIIGIGLDKAQKLRNYARTLGINYPILRAGPEQFLGLFSGGYDKLADLPAFGHVTDVRMFPEIIEQRLVIGYPFKLGYAVLL